MRMELNPYLDLGFEMRHELNLSQFIFWPNWAVTSGRPSRISDEKVRDFITKTVRRKKDELLRLADYNRFYDEMIYDSETVGYRGLEREEKREFLEIQAIKFLT